jgi:tRNA(fMet)-specific endonuclease VapC
MSLVVLDTDVLTLYQLGDPAVVRRVQSLPLSQLGVSVISIEEELTGWYTRLRRARKRDQLARVYQRLTDSVRFLARFQIVSFTEPPRSFDMRICARLIDDQARTICGLRPSFWRRMHPWQPAISATFGKSKAFKSKTGRLESGLPSCHT